MTDASSSEHEDRPSYPAGLAQAEFEVLSQRRVAAGLPLPPSDTPTTGIAVSGGGIRSAIFALGVFQALAARDRLRQVDYLSTVSGGSYFGSFLTALFARGHDHAAVAKMLTGQQGRDQINPVEWLRQNGRYLAPRGGTDTFRIFGIVLRNWLAMAAVVSSLLLMFMLVLQLGVAMTADTVDAAATALLANLGFEPLWTERPWCLGGLPLSPFAAIPLALLIPAATCGIAYWFVGAFSEALRGRLSVSIMMAATRLLVWKLIGRTLDGAAKDRAEKIINDWLEPVRWNRQARSWLTTGFATSLLLAVITALWAFIDSAALLLSKTSSANGLKLSLSASAVGAAALALRKLLTTPAVSKALSTLWGGRAFSMRLLLWPTAILIWGSVLIAIDTLALSLLEHLMRPDALKLLAALAVAHGLLALSPYFLNRSSQHSFYAERLIRTFIGASNRQRFPEISRSKSSNAYVSSPIADDGGPSRFHADAVAHGGPLHLINVTVNETRSHYAATMLRDRKGVPMSVGPCGYSAGVEHHAVLVQEGGVAEYPSFRPINRDESNGQFQMFGDRDFQPEPLSLGYWTAISGAAVASGLGSYGGSAQSLLVSFANLRLGYWWRTGTVGAFRRPEPSAPSRWQRFTQALRDIDRIRRQQLIPMQGYLFAEFTGSFFGPHRGHWYLSDGGHSENTGALELIRRRVDEIIIIDAEGDPSAPTGNLGELVRKARQDYGAEIEFEPETMPPFAGYRLIKPGDDGLGDACAVRGTVRYPNSSKRSRLLYVRPVLSAADTPDLIRYHADNPDFPYQSTADQFFDEAQWESYRKLGESIGLRVFR